MHGTKPILLFLSTLPSLILSGCGSDSNTELLRKKLSGQLSFAIAMSDMLDTGSPQWCTSGTTSWGTYYNEGEFLSDQILFTPNGGMPLSETDRATTLGYLAFKVLKAQYVRTTTGLIQRCYAFDRAAAESVHAVFRNGAASHYQLSNGVAGEAHDPNWDVLVPIGTFSPDTVTFVNEYKSDLGVEYTCRSYQAVVSFHGIVPSLEGRKFQARASFCLDPQDNQWHQQGINWATPQ